MSVNMSFGLLDINGKILKSQIKSNRRKSDTLIQLIVSLSGFKTQLDMFLCNLLKLTLPWQGGWTKMISRGRSQPYKFCDSAIVKDKIFPNNACC